MSVTVSETAWWPPFSRPDEASAVDGPPTLVRGRGVWLERQDGGRLLDGVGALEAMAVGHGRQRLVDAAARQMQELAFLDVFRYSSPPALSLADKLISIAPPGMDRVLFTPGGSEAVETALKLALQYHWVRGDRNRRLVVCRNGAYHGVTFGAMNCDGGYYSTRNDVYLGDNRFGVIAQGPATGEGWGKGAPYAAGAAQFAATIEEVGPENVAAVIVDPCATASGVAAAPPSDLKALRALCDAHGILLIADEVITGFCRTGEMFASQLAGVTPDLMTVSKALSSGYMPIGATVVHSKVTKTINDVHGPDGIFAHGHTYGGHPVACAVAAENIAILEEEGLAEAAAAKGAYLRDGLATLSHHGVYADSRGVGMLNGLEVFPGGDADAGRFGTAAAACVWLRKRLRDIGLVTLTVHPGRVFLLAPPLVISNAEIDTLVAMLDQGLNDLEAAR
ncbi:aspartate aminotransferase family protein [Streptomyces sp. NPDC020801]|uniref:aminotransferase family protein n=1 Tax=unclassified Streptomyces TaxID=2593676 RepID=UPI0037A8D530